VGRRSLSSVSRSATGMTGACPLLLGLDASTLRARRAVASPCTSNSGRGCPTSSCTSLVVGLLLPGLDATSHLAPRTSASAVDVFPLQTRTTRSKSFLGTTNCPPRPQTAAPRQDPALRRSLSVQLDGAASTACRTVTDEPPARAPHGASAASTSTTLPRTASLCARH
jgi:hypothetical protein